MSHENLIEEHPLQYDMVRRQGYEEEAGFIDRVLTRQGLGGGMIVDAGCGTGEHARLLSGLGYKVTGIDSSERLVEFARSKKIAGARFEKADMREYNVSSDAVICMHASINYLKDEGELGEALANFYRNLNPGGVLIIGTRHYEMLREEPKYVMAEDLERKVLLISEWKRGEGMSATNTMMLAEFSQAPFIGIEEHQLNFLSPFFIQRGMEAAGFEEAQLHWGFGTRDGPEKGKAGVAITGLKRRGHHNL